ncbi:hypothetical protein AB0M58_44210, partial [Streptomyces bobili]|uniref:hypothetical protein n=1 Tax=Streptomyces bobili TaxID=67280 RepID=UPI0034281542
AQSSTRITFPPDLDHQGQSQTKITKWVTFDPPAEGQRSAVVEIPGLVGGRGTIPARAGSSSTAGTA